MKQLIFACSVKKDLFRIAPIVKRLKDYSENINITICYCGPEIKYEAHKKLYDQIGLPIPEYHFSPIATLFNDQIYQLSSSFETTINKIKPDLVVIPSYYYLALGFANACSNNEIPICLLDAGLRDITEEEPMKNYRATMDSLSSLFLVSEEYSILNLMNEGVDESKIFHVGNTLYECLNEMLTLIGNIEIAHITSDKKFALAYLFTHQGSTSREKDQVVVAFLKYIITNFQVIIPVSSAYAGTRLEKLNKTNALDLKILGRMEYPDYLALLKHALFVFTDSCSIQEEATFFGVPCISLLDTSERYDTEHTGTNIPVGYHLNKLVLEVNRLTTSATQPLIIRELKLQQTASAKIVQNLLNFFNADFNI